MKKYEITLTNGRHTIINEHSFDFVIKEPYVSSVKLIKNDYNIKDIAMFIISNSEVISNNGISFCCRFVRPCDIIFFELYKYTDDEWSHSVKFYIQKKKYSVNITKTICDIVTFYENYFKDLEKYNQSKERNISTKEINEIKKICFYNKDGIKSFFDIYGNVYYCYKALIPSKKQKEEYKKFHNKKDSVRIGYVVDNKTCKLWFENKEEAEMFVKNNNITIWYIDKYGYNKCNPDDKKIYTQLPYFNILQEYSEIKEIHKVAWKWFSSCKTGDYGTVLILVKGYLDFFIKSEIERVKFESEKI